MDKVIIGPLQTSSGGVLKCKVEVSLGKDRFLSLRCLPRFKRHCLVEDRVFLLLDDPLRVQTHVILHQR